MANTWLLLGAIFGFLTVALGAFGAHSLKDVLDEYSRSIYEKAVLYQMFHAMALLVLGVLRSLRPELSLQGSGWAFVIGIVLFSGSLYLLAITGWRFLGAITPFGGVAFLIGWGLLAFQMWR